ncbi:MAG: hypothetical protein HYZ28_18600 [Myxococcales bacterium]|nr:hypothetical protein [Myxococcales bacterium]
MRSSHGSAAVAVLELDELFADELRPILHFDFSGKRAPAPALDLSDGEPSTLKEAIARWLEEQL